MIDIVLLQRDDIYFQSTWKLTEQERVKEKKPPATQNWNDLGQAKHKMVRGIEIKKFAPTGQISVLSKHQSKHLVSGTLALTK